MNDVQRDWKDRRPQSLTLIGLLFLTTLVLGTVWRPVDANLGRPAETDPALRIGIDPNAATWFEWAQLPGIGESLARKIVARRDARTDSADRTDAPVFEKPEYLLSVPGIGPRTLARISPYLVFSAPPVSVDSPHASR